MKVNKDTLTKLRTLYFNLTGNSAVLDDYSFFKYLCNNGSWIQCFGLCKKAIDKMLQEGENRPASFTTQSPVKFYPLRL